MTTIAIEPVRGPVDASVEVPGSKSLTNRALVLAALAEGRTTLVNASRAEDCRDMARALGALGWSVETRADGSVSVDGHGGRIPGTGQPLRAGSGGTTSRFLIALAAAGEGEFEIDAAPRMRQRPVADLLAALRQLGADITSTDDHLPVRVRARGLAGGRVVVSGDVSSQFLSALLLVAPCAREMVELVVAGGLTSRPYVAMTIAMMRAFDVEVAWDGRARFTVRPAVYRSPSTFAIEPDASSASYFFAIPALLGGRVRVDGISRRSCQGDIAFLDLLDKMGCDVIEENAGVTVASSGRFRGVEADLADMPDTSLTLAAMAPFASSPTTIRGIATARLKESDRVSAVCRELDRLGVDVVEREDGMIVAPSAGPHGGLVRTYDDHRMAMAFALIGLRVPGIVIENPGCVAKSFPDFFHVLAAVGGGAAKQGPRSE
jgi:3-phosphoshikimate 1-carboxyvinyltransferase